MIAEEGRLGEYLARAIGAHRRLHGGRQPSRIVLTPPELTILSREMDYWGGGRTSFMERRPKDRKFMDVPIVTTEEC